MNEFDGVIIDTRCIKKLTTYFKMIKSYKWVPVKVFYEREGKMRSTPDFKVYNKETRMEMLLDIQEKWRKELDVVAKSFQ